MSVQLADGMPAIPVRYVRVKVFCTLTGYTPDAVDGKIRSGVWIEGKHFRRAPDNHILIDLWEYNAWVESPPRAA